MAPLAKGQRAEAHRLLGRLKVGGSISFGSMTKRVERTQTEEGMERLLEKLRQLVYQYDFKKAKGSETIC